MTTSPALSALARALMLHNVTYDLFATTPEIGWERYASGRRLTKGGVKRGSRDSMARLREKVWATMREPDPVTGQVLSYPEIAAVTTGRGHCTVLEAVRRYNKSCRQQCVPLSKSLKPRSSARASSVSGTSGDGQNVNTPERQSVASTP